MSSVPTALHEPAFRSPDLSNSLSYMGNINSFLVNAEETDGRFTMLRFFARPGGEPPPHVHHYEHEIMYVLEGEIECFIEGQEKGIVAKPGETIYLPRGRAHAYYFRSPVVRALAMVHALKDGKGTEAYLKEMALGPAQSMELPEVTDQYRSLDPEQMKQAGERATAHGVTFLEPEAAAERLPFYPGFGANVQTR